MSRCAGDESTVMKPQRPRSRSTADRTGPCTTLGPRPDHRDGRLAFTRRTTLAPPSVSPPDICRLESEHNTTTILLQFNGLFSRTTRVSRYQKGRTNLDFTGARDSEWQWHQLGHMQVCTSLQTDNHTSTPPLKFFTGRMPFLPPNQQRQSTEGTKNETKQ